VALLDGLAVIGVGVVLLLVVETEAWIRNGLLARKRDR
jgi:hypothetical protein